MSFTPVIRTSRNILKTLRDFASERKIDPKSLEFELLSYETLISRSGDDGYEVLDKTHILCEDELLDPLFSIVQEYSIKIIPKESYKAISTIDLSLAADKFKIRAVATIAQGSVLVRHKGVIKELRNAIWKKKLLAGFFIDFFEQNLIEQLKKLVTIVPLDKPTSKELKFIVAAGIAMQPPLDAKLVRVYEAVQQTKTLIEGVQSGELILKYIKPKSGIDGRGCDGKYIKVREPREIDVKPSIDDSIRCEEDENEIDYFAQIDGYVVFESNCFLISKKLILQSANFKSTGGIDTGGDKDISVHIGGLHDRADDAISSGVKIDVKELNVDGSIGSNVNITAADLSIGEQTHRKSKIEVSNVANIRLHKGDLSANEANIEILEAGKVNARTSINIGRMLGGEAIAPIVRVDEMLSNCVIIASELIEIKKINGTGVKLIIDPSSIDAYHKKIEDLKESIKFSSLQIKSQKEQLTKDIKEHLAGVERIKKFQAKVLQAQKAGQEPMKQDIIRLRQYKKTSEELKNKETLIEQEQIALEKLELELKQLYEQDLHAKIIHHGNYDGHTQIVFVNPKNQEKVVAAPVGIKEIITAVKGAKGREIKFD